MTYTATASNVATATATDVVLTSSVPATTNFVSSSGNCTRPRQDSIRCTLGNLEPGQSATATFTVTPTQAGTLNNRADVSVAGNADVNKGNDQKTTTATVNPATSGPNGSAVKLKLTKAFKKTAKSAKVRITLPLPGKVAFKLTGSGTLAKGSATFRSAGNKTITMKFSKKSQKKLKKLKANKKLSLKVTLTPSDGSKKQSKTLKLVVTKKGSIKGA